MNLGQRALIAMMMDESQWASYRGPFPFRARELIADSTDEQLIGYPKGQPARVP